MHREVDRTCEQCILDLLGEEAFAAHLRQRPVANHVAGGADDLELDLVGGETVDGGQALAHLPRLDDRERAAARPDAQNGS